MEYKINFEMLRKNYRMLSEDSEVKVKLTHKPGNRIKMLPYPAHFANKDKEIVAQFKGVIGEFSRLLTSKRVASSGSVKTFVDLMVDKVIIEKTEIRLKLKEILLHIFLNEKNEVNIFHPLVLNYIDSLGNDHANIAKFLYSILCNDELKEVAKENYYKRPNNVLLNLAYDSLPELESLDSTDFNLYKLYLPKVKQLFYEDFKFILSDSKLLVENIDKLLKYYYFLYVSQLALKLDRMFKIDGDEIEPIYFNLDWENTSKKRTSYALGWDNLSSHINHLFAHAICLDFLNHRVEDSNIAYTYLDIKNLITEMNEEEKVTFRFETEEIFSLYKKMIGDVEWDKFNILDPYEDETYNAINKLFRAIDFQFNQPMSGRKGADKKYSSWFEEYCKCNFLKKRGSLGLTLNITQDYLIFITRLCIKDKQKIRLKVLFQEYEKRGLFFDRDSKEKIIHLFEKLNLLEKKSDSGDAQYVKSIL